jgi:hypothetical protein
MSKNNDLTCLYCGQDQNQVPLVEITYKGKQFQICTAHFPILIHDPGELSGKLPGAEDLPPADHQH